MTMRVRSGKNGSRARLAGVLALLGLLTAGCTSAAETPSAAGSVSNLPVVLRSLPFDLPTASPTRVMCQDGPNAPTPMPANCFVPTPPPTPSPTLLVTPPPAPMATPTPIDSESRDGTGYFSQSILPGKTISVPLDFEGSTWAWVAVYSDSTAVSGTFNGAALTGAQSALGWTLTYEPAKPVSGTLALKNTGKTSVNVAGYILITTQRHLVVALADTFVPRNQRFAIDVVLTQPTDADTLTVAIAGQASSEPVAMTKVDTGHWTGTASVSQPGDYDIRASTGGSRTRVSSYPLTVFGDDMKIISAPAETAIDTNGDGLIDELDFAPTVSMDESGTFDVQGELFDPAGKYVTGSNTEPIAFTAGVPKTLTIHVQCDGFYRLRISGLFELRLRVSHFADPHELYDAWDLVVRKTAAYDYTRFVH
jgi:hypothetical protein